MAEVLVVHNPKSRRGQRFARDVRGWLESNGLADGVVFQPLAELQAAAAPSTRVVCVGGDGTVNAVLSWLFAKGVECPVGIVPAGTGNNLAGGLDIPLATSAACDIAFRSDSRRRIDAITYRGSSDRTVRLIVQSASLGFPAEITAQYDRLREGRTFRLLAAPVGTLIYKILALLGLSAQKKRERRGEVLTMRCRFPSADGGREIEIDEKVLAVFIHNEPTVGGGFVPCPAARVDDGLIDLCILKAGTGVSYLKLFKEAGKGEHVKRTDTVIYEQTPGPLTIEFSSSSPFVSDGDIWVADEGYEIELHPRRFGLSVREPVAGGGRASDASAS